MLAIALLHSLLRPCTHPVRHGCLMWHFFTPLYDHVHTQYAMDACCSGSPLPSRTIYTPSTPWVLDVALLHSPLRPCTPRMLWMLAVRTLHAPLRPYTHPVRHVWLMWHSSTLFYDHAHTQYAMDACCSTSSLPSTTIYVPRSHGCLL